MIFDERLTCKDHIKCLIERCNKDINVLRLVSGSTFGADKVTLLRLYKALILSKIDYGSQAYEVHSKSSRTPSITLISNVGFKKKLHVEKDEYWPCNLMQHYQY